MSSFFASSRLNGSLGIFPLAHCVSLTLHCSLVYFINLLLILKSVICSHVSLFCGIPGIPPNNQRELASSCISSNTSCYKTSHSLCHCVRFGQNINNKPIDDPLTTRTAHTIESTVIHCKSAFQFNFVSGQFIILSWTIRRSGGKTGRARDVDH